MAEAENMKIQQAGLQPDSRLQAYEKLVGKWKMHSRDLNTGEEWDSEETYKWLPGGFYLVCEHEEFSRNIKGTMLIGYEKRWEAEQSDDVTGHWFEGSTGNHFIYFWDMNDEGYTTWLETKGSSSFCKATFNNDKTIVNGQWTWTGGGYDFTMTKGG